jgi:N-acetylmuramoyl-L-alanine amidase
MRNLLAVIGFCCVLGFSSNAFAYEVKPNDTMSSIARENKLSLHALSSLNPQVKNLDLIFVGQEINTVVTSSTPAPSVTSTVASNEEKDLLARLVRAEAESEPYSGKVAVAYVVLNRVDSEDFPNTIREVIYQKGQFTPVSNGAINTPADSESKRAVEEALTSNRALGKGSLFFYNPSTATSRWLDSKETTLVIANHTFKK